MDFDWLSVDLCFKESFFFFSEHLSVDVVFSIYALSIKILLHLLINVFSEGKIGDYLEHLDV